MADDVADGVNTAGVYTRVATLLIDAGHLIRAFAITDALVSAVRRCSDKFSQARAGRLIVDHLALRVRSAGRRLARINGGQRIHGFKDNDDRLNDA